METEKPFADGSFLLEKFAGKGGWTYAVIPDAPAHHRQMPFGWLNVRGSIDDYPLEHYKLMPMGKGKLFLPVKAAIRKQIHKQSGDWVHIVLYLDAFDVKIPEELLECFNNEPAEVYHSFLAMAESEQKMYIDWIRNAKSEEIKALRISEMLEKVAKGLRFRQTLNPKIIE